MKKFFLRPAILFTLIVCSLYYQIDIVMAQDPSSSGVEDLTSEEASGEGGIATALGVSVQLTIAEEKVDNGDVITFGKDGYKRAVKAYDQNVVGVVTEKPAIYINFDTEGKTYAVATSGTVLVNISTAGGTIKKGDLLTTSETPGIAVRANRSGFVIGNALEDYSNSDPKAVSQIAVNLNVHFFYSTKQAINQSLSDILNLSALAFSEQPSAVFRYVIAGLVLLLSVVFAFLSFARIAKNGIEALGRNPLASRLIQIGIIFNVIISVVIIAAGALVAFIIVRL